MIPVVQFLKLSNGQQFFDKLRGLENVIIYSQFDVSGSQITHQAAGTHLTLRYIMKGIEECTVNGSKNYELHEGQFLIVSGGENIKSKVTQGGGKTLSISLSNQFILECIQQVVSDNYTPGILNFEELVWSTETSKLGTALKHFEKEVNHYMDDTSQNWNQLTINLINELCAHAQTESQAIQRIGASKRSTRLDLYKRIHNAKEYLHKHIYKSITLDDLCEVANLSKFHFVRLFNSIYSVSPFKYLQNLRLQRANVLLSESNYSVGEAAALLQFSDISYFSNCFKKYYGIRPSKLLK